MFGKNAYEIHENLKGWWFWICNIFEIYLSQNFYGIY